MLTRIDKDLSAIAGAEAGAFIAMVSLSCYLIRLLLPPS